LTSGNERRVVTVVPDPDGSWRVVAPAVGLWRDPPAEDALLGPGSDIGILRTLGRSTRLVLPDATAGRAVELPARRVVAVGWGDTLFRLVPLTAASATASGADPAAVCGDRALDGGARAVTAPTDGVFYRRAAPDAPAFVEVGESVQDGQPVGLVEVMKTFNQVVYSGPPPVGRVLEIRCDDGQEVRAGQVLVVVG
jgi:acetyl-CoA carboxylase biotin carboxyl carrier protein